MKFVVDQRIFEQFPEAAIGVLWISGLENQGTNDRIEALLRAEEARQAELLSGIELTSLPEIRVWREAFKKFGADPRDHRSSVEALLRRARAGNKPLPTINPLVDLYNMISLKHHVPVGAEDLAKIRGVVQLTFADGTESGLTLGSHEEETCTPGEVIYRDDVSFICRRWNWREADRTKIEHSTRDAVLVIDTVGGINVEILSHALDETEELIRAELKASVTREIHSRG